MEIRKERNILTAYDGQIKIGGFNISDGTWIGKSGKQVKAFPRCFTYDSLEHCIGSYWSFRYDSTAIFARAIKLYREYYCSAYGARYTPERAQRLEALISVGLYPASTSDLNDTTRLSKDLVNYLKENCRCEYRASTVRDYLRRKDFAVLENDAEMPFWTSQIVGRICGVNEAMEIPVDYYRSAIKRCAQEKVYEFAHSMNNIGSEPHFIFEVIFRYYTIAKKLFGSVKVERNFLVHLSELITLEKKYDDEHYNEELEKHNNLPALYYEDETFIIRPLLTRDAFHDEATQQNNCVERLYMSEVHDGDTHVVQVRRKDRLNKSYITCEVGRRGNIEQWLMVNNTRPTGEEAGLLKRAYAEHLRANWEN